MNQQDYKHWNLSLDKDNLAWLCIDKHQASANTLSREVLDELDRVITELENLSPDGLLLISGKSSGFIAGADVHEFAQREFLDHAYENIRQAQRLFDRIESLAVPSCALIDGFCLGGGLELVLACDYRIATDGDSTKIGLPEVKLGIHPGYGGSVRLIRQVGALKAMDLMLRGRVLAAKPARNLGVVDEIVPRRHLEKAGREFVLETPAPRQPSIVEQAADYPLLRPIVASLMRRKLAAKVNEKHYPAPFALIDVWRRDGAKSNNMFAAEARSVANLVENNTAQQLVRSFFLQDRLKSVNKNSGDKVEHVHVVGAGVMGGDIAAWCALRGFEVTLQDREPRLIAPALARAAQLFEHKLYNEPARMAARDRLSADPAGDGVAKADIVIEAIVENVAIKQALFEHLESRMKPQALLATNTSSIPLERLAEVLKQPDRLLGLHFFNPVVKMPLVEIVIGDATPVQHAERAAVFVKALNKLPLPVKSAPGFLVNRVLMPYLLEAMVMIDEGIDPAVIDHAATEFGMPVGPITLADTVGLDVCLSVAEILGKAFDLQIPSTLRDKVAMHHLGKKSGQGFYDYELGKPSELRKNVGGSEGIIADRLIYRLLNECSASLREQIVEDADLLDAGMIFGTGFAPFRGGPMQFAREVGVDNVIGRLQRLEQEFGARFAPDTGWSTNTLERPRSS